MFRYLALSEAMPLIQASKTGHLSPVSSSKSRLLIGPSSNWGSSLWSTQSASCGSPPAHASRCPSSAWPWLALGHTMSGHVALLATGITSHHYPGITWIVGGSIAPRLPENVGGWKAFRFCYRPDCWNIHPLVPMIGMGWVLVHRPSKKVSIEKPSWMASRFPARRVLQ